MTDSPALDPAGVPQSAPARPETVPLDAAGPVPSPGATEPRPADGTTLILQTTLFGPLAVPNGAARAAEIEELSRRAAVYATRARGDGTRRAYRAAWRQFDVWCRTRSAASRSPPIPTPSPCVVRCADQGFAVSSIREHLAAIRTAHLLAGLSLALRHPRLAMVVEGVTRAKGVRPRRQAAPAVPGVLRLMRPTSRARARTLPSGPTQRRKDSARWQRSTPGSYTAAPPRTSTRPQPSPPGPSARCSAPSPRPAG